VRLEVNGNKVTANCVAYLAAGSENIIEVWLG
jgi:hypothetical protein